MRGVLAAGLSVGLAAAVVGTAVLASAVSLLGVGGGAPARLRGGNGTDPAGHADALPAGGGHVPGAALDDPRRHRHRRVGQRQSNLPGVHSGANAAGAEGPMQFEPATFAAYDEPVPPGGAVPPSPYDPTDAVYAAARLLCADGASGGADLSGAVYAYNHSASYVAQVLALAQSLRGRRRRAIWRSAAGRRRRRGVVGAVPDRHALRLGRRDAGRRLRLLGPRAGGLRGGGLALPRVAQDQYDRTPKLGAGRRAGPGRPRLLRGGPGSIDHVGLFAGVVDGQDVMIDAPHTGADVRAEAFPATPGASFGSLLFVGATRPA